MEQNSIVEFEELFNRLETNSNYLTRDTNLGELKEKIVYETLNKNSFSINDLKSTIKLSYGIKKKLDDNNTNNASYEELIKNLIEENTQLKYENSMLKNQLNNSELVKIDSNSYKRTQKIFNLLDIKIRYSYNKMISGDRNYQFKIKFEKAKKKGAEISLEKCFQIVYIIFSQDEIINLDEAKKKGEYIIYFMILSELLKENFNIKLRISHKMITRINYWEYILNKLNIPNIIKEEDVNEKIKSYKLKLNHL